MSTPVQLTDVRKVYGTGAGAVTALAGVTHGFEAGTFTAVMGPSGRLAMRPKPMDALSSPVG